MVGQERFHVCVMCLQVPESKACPREISVLQCLGGGGGYRCPLVVFTLAWVLSLPVVMARHTGPPLPLYGEKCSEKKSPKWRGGGW